ncbi:hypothetical protein [Algoriphagus vanfongensis]|uniref:hypothetical protein n=1 Tax=Algoriphagus vanfongensis TaxID=426371 RepID=UPI0003FDEABA|nr:hypothetical protein [Algoriphagus vanfongensis]
MRKLLLPLLVICLLAGCKEDEQPDLICGVQNPAEEIAWVKELVQDMESSEFSREYSYLRSGVYDGETYLYVGNCCPNCYWVPVIYNCEGEVVEDPDFGIYDLVDLRMIYHSEASICDFDED